MVVVSHISIGLNASVLEALRVIENGSAQIALVVDDKKCLLGTLTDGDIRRGLLRGETLEAPVHLFMNRQFRFVRSGDDQAVVLKMMRREKLGQIPVIDSEGRVVQVLLLNELLAPAQLPNAVVIMAGGKEPACGPTPSTVPSQCCRWMVSRCWRSCWSNVSPVAFASFICR